jgi:hypothetical protein
MVAVPALIILDQLISYVRVSPGKNASMVRGREETCWFSAVNATGTRPKAMVRANKTTVVEKAR